MEERQNNSRQRAMTKIWKFQLKFTLNPITWHKRKFYRSVTLSLQDKIFSVKTQPNQNLKIPFELKPKFVPKPKLPTEFLSKHNPIREKAKYFPSKPNSTYLKFSFEVVVLYIFYIFNERRKIISCHLKNALIVNQLPQICQ